MTTAFVVFCAVMALVAIFMLAYPLLRPLPAAERGEVPPSKATPLAFAVSVTLAVAAALLYSQVSNFPWDNPITAQAVPPGHGEMGQGASMQQAIAELEARLAKNPNDQEGWRMLGRSYLVSGEFAKAVTPYERAMSLDSTPAIDLQLDLAEALVLAGDPQQQARAKTIIDGALSTDPDSQKALWYRGVMAARSGDNETAKTSWSRLLEQNPPAEIRDILVAQLREIGGEVPAAAAAAASTPPMGGMSGGATGGMGGDVAPKGRTIRVKVSVDPSLVAKLKPGAPLFVAAREPGIPGPPIAAVRLSADQLPTTVVLSDANTMIEGRDLSSVADVEIVARVAFSGTPAVASGDLIGSVVQSKGGPESVDVVIGKVQP